MFRLFLSKDASTYLETILTGRSLPDRRPTSRRRRRRRSNLRSLRSLRPDSFRRCQDRRGSLPDLKYIKLYNKKRGLPGAARDYFTIQL